SLVVGTEPDAQCRAHVVLETLGGIGSGHTGGVDDGRRAALPRGAHGAGPRSVEGRDDDVERTLGARAVGHERALLALVLRPAAGHDLEGAARRLDRCGGEVRVLDQDPRPSPRERLLLLARPSQHGDLPRPDPCRGPRATVSDGSTPAGRGEGHRPRGSVAATAMPSITTSTRRTAAARVNGASVRSDRALTAPNSRSVTASAPTSARSSPRRCARSMMDRIAATRGRMIAARTALASSGSVA